MGHVLDAKTATSSSIQRDVQLRRINNLAMAALKHTLSTILVNSNSPELMSAFRMHACLYDVPVKKHLTPTRGHRFGLGRGEEGKEAISFC
jgi:hypothetical protein